MKAQSLRIRGLLLLESGLLLWVGVYFALRAATLPYGRFWPAWLVGAILASLVPLIVFFRFQGLAKRLTGARLFKLAIKDIPEKSGHTYLGEGFIWGPAQTQLLLDYSAKGFELPAEARDSIAGDWLIHGIGADRMGPLFLPDSLLNQHIYLMRAPGSG